MGRIYPEYVGPYKLIYKMGSGTVADVFQGYCSSTGERVALKIAERSKLKDMEILESVEKEIRISEQLHNKNIASFDHVFFLDKFIVLSMECLGNGSLTYMKSTTIFPLSNPIYLRWGKDILNGLAYLHKKHIVHHDIKPDNIGFDDYMNAKIIDLGLCEEFKDFCHFSCGTPLYTAPEVFFSNKYDGTKADIWSFGITFHYMVTGTLPFTNIEFFSNLKSPKNIMKNIKITCPEPLRRIVELSLIFDPSKRPSAEDLLKLKIFEEAEKDVCPKNFIGVSKPSKRRTLKNIIITPLPKKNENKLHKRSSNIALIRKSNLLSLK